MEVQDEIRRRRRKMRRKRKKPKRKELKKLKKRLETADTQLKQALKEYLAGQTETYATTVDEPEAAEVPSSSGTSAQQTSASASAPKTPVGAPGPAKVPAYVSSSGKSSPSQGLTLAPEKESSEKPAVIPAAVKDETYEQVGGEAVVEPPLPISPRFCTNWAQIMSFYVSCSRLSIVLLL
ncbi:unnamed protein product [Strongylus vulgaris]|uniref:Uncharacterized protein n=1 Tax=Strongylus vulgaris TaxID=40348 RepID=A0A3P7IZ16_STRVU|nr:unnamed protein product [Strongylus vulgaris]